jgi:tetratricopeptide (TPR) repeat protein
MEYTDIIRDISSQLTGDSSKDMAILQAEAEKYRSHESSQEILRAIGRMMYQILPDDMKQEFNQSFSNMQLSTDTVLDEVKTKVHEGDLAEAESMIKTILPPEGMYQEDQVSVYFAFNTPIEEIYYKSKFKPQKDVRIIPDIDLEVFLTYAYIMIEKQRLDEAMDLLERGLQYNPLETKLLFEKGEILKLRKNWDGFKEATDLCLEYSYSSENVARAYRNYGFMFIELEDYEAAICCYLMSLQYDQSDMAQSQLFYISQVTNNQINPEDYFESIEEVFAERKIMLRANPELLQIAFALGNQFEDDGIYEDAFYCYSIIYALTEDANIKEKLREMKSLIEQ